ncbi:hypothetical protein ACSFBM_28715 [Variovorax sp. GB1R11]|uniref:hypothetical protein n=1 Tax=Variovorax sp. GB1R11 TaxID=3443741 RepID=UPI003F477B90
MLLKPDMDRYWAGAQARIDEILMPMAIKAKCFPEGTTADDLEKHIVELRPATGESQPSDPRLRAAEAVRLLYGICHAGFALSNLQATAYARLANIPMGDHRAAAMQAVDEPFLQGHADLYATFEDFAPQMVGYLGAIQDFSQHNAQRGAAGRREIGEQTTSKVKEAAPKFMHLPKDSAATLIAEEIGRSASTVRRLLSELFPGPAWVRQIPGSDTLSPAIRQMTSDDAPHDIH